MQKRVGVIHDISCEGRCSMSAALPILSAAGIHPNLIPTALLSTQTGGYTGYTYLDLTEEMLPIARHFKNLKLKFDVVYSGYLASLQQIDIVMEIGRLLSPRLMVVDPVMGDSGKLYSGFTDEYTHKMKELCKMADVVTPNVTEACLLSQMPYENMDEVAVRSMLKRLLDLGPKAAVVTGIHMGDEMAVAVHDGNQFYLRRHKCIDGIYHGAGDVFGSVVVAGLAYAIPLIDSVEIACDFTLKAICRTEELGTDTRQGLCFEEGLEKLFSTFINVKNK